MGEIIYSGFDAPETPADKVDAHGETVAGTDEGQTSAIDRTLEKAIDAATGYREGENAAEAEAINVLPPPTQPKKSALFDPKTPYEKSIAEHLEKTASDALIEKIREARKAGYTIRTCFAYITEQARKQAKDGCAMVADDVVYGWSVHYFEDEWQADAKRKAKADAKRAKSEAERKAKADAEAARLAALTPEERELEQRAKDEAESEKALAERELSTREQVESVERHREDQRMLKGLEASAYEATLKGESLSAPEGWTREQKVAVKAGVKRAKAEISAAKKTAREAKSEARRRAEEMQGDLFAGIL